MRARNVCTGFLRNPAWTRVASRRIGSAHFWFPWSGTLAILFDQSKAGATQALFAESLSRPGLAVAVYTFQYPWQEKDRAQPESAGRSVSRGYRDALPTRVRPVFIGDRGYARAALLRQSNRQGRLYIISWTRGHAR